MVRGTSKVDYLTSSAHPRATLKPVTVRGHPRREAVKQVEPNMSTSEGLPFAENFLGLTNAKEALGHPREKTYSRHIPGRHVSG